MPKSKHQIPGRVRAIYEFIKQQQRQHSVEAMCRILEVAPSGYYDWLKQLLSNRAQEDARLLRLIRASFVASHGIYGAPRVFLDLGEAGETCSKHRVARLCARPTSGPFTGIGRGAGRWASRRAQRRLDGRAAPTAARDADPLRSGHAVRQRRLASLLPLLSHAAWNVTRPPAALAQNPGWYAALDSGAQVAVVPLRLRSGGTRENGPPAGEVRCGAHRQRPSSQPPTE